MFKLDNYTVYFKHNQYSHAWCKGVTRCFILRGEDETPFEIAYAVCSRSDQFNKAIGRKIALARALERFDKETRSRFWKAYFETGAKK